MGLISFWQFMLLLAIVLLILGMRRPPWAYRGVALFDEYWPRLRHELKSRVPVYSAETTQGKEAEFIRDRVPQRFPALIVLVAVAAFGAVAWWLMR
jgi:hypothetical protein